MPVHFLSIDGPEHPWQLAVPAAMPVDAIGVELSIVDDFHAARMVGAFATEFAAPAVDACIVEANRIIRVTALQCGGKFPIDFRVADPTRFFPIFFLARKVFDIVEGPERGRGPTGFGNPGMDLIASRGIVVAGGDSCAHTARAVVVTDHVALVVIAVRVQ